MEEKDTMRAAVFAGPRDIRVETVPLKRPEPDQVRIRLEGCGLCASNLPVWLGAPWFDYPFEPGSPGHEGWGRIDAVGDKVHHLKVGERVAFLSEHAYAESDVAPADAVVPLPESQTDQPFPGEPLGCALNIFRRSRIAAGQTVAVIGIGFLGALLTRLSADAGARVIAVSRRSFALETARRFGASEVISIEDRDTVLERVHALTGGEGCDCVIEVVGKQYPLDLAAELVRVRGRLVIAGYHQDGPRQVDMQSWNWRGIDVINAHEREQAVYIRGIRDAVEAVAAKRLDPSPLFTHTFSLDRLNEAFAMMEQRPDGFMKALLCF